MASIQARKNKKGEVISYRFRACVGRDDEYRQIWRTATIPRPEGLTPAKERKEVERLADAWEQAERDEYEKETSIPGYSTRKAEAIAKEKETLSHFITEVWFPKDVQGEDNSPETVSFYARTSKPALSFFRDTPIRAIDRGSCKDFIAYLNNELRTESGEPYSGTSRMHFYSTFRTILSAAVDREYIRTNPAAGMKKSQIPHRDVKPVDYLTMKELQAFLSALDQEPLIKRAYFMLSAQTGMRRGEVVALKWSDINRERRTIRVARAAVIDKNDQSKRKIKPTKTEHIRTLPLMDETITLLDELLASREDALQVKLMPDSFIFCEAANPFLCLYPTTPTRWASQIVKKAHIRNVSPQILRRSFATLLQQDNTDTKTAQTLLGHSDAATTHKYYTGVDSERMREAVETYTERTKQTKTG